MTIERDEVERIARLARLELAPDEVETFREQLRAILDWADSLSVVDVSGIHATHAGVGEPAPLRLDEPQPSAGTAGALSNAPDTDEECFRVPPVIE